MGTRVSKNKKQALTGSQGSRYERLTNAASKDKKVGKATNAHYRIRTQKKVDKLNTLRTK